MPSCLTAVLVSPPSSWRDGNGEGDSTNSAHLGCARHGSDACRPRQRSATSRTSSESGLQLNCEGHHALQLRQLRQSSPSAYEAYLRGLGEKPHSVGSASSRPSRALIEHSRSPTFRLRRRQADRNHLHWWPSYAKNRQWMGTDLGQGWLATL